MGGVRGGGELIPFENASPTKESVELAWSKVGGICNNRRLAKDKPYIQKLFYIRGILRNRLGYFDQNRGLRLLEDAIETGASIESLEKFAKDVRNWTEWRNGMEKFIESKQSKSEDISTNE